MSDVPEAGGRGTAAPHAPVLVNPGKKVQFISERLNFKFVMILENIDFFNNFRFIVEFIIFLRGRFFLPPGQGIF